MNTPEPRSSRRPDPLPEESIWLAVRYYLGELPAEQAEAFQARLEHDEAAQQALAEAVQLCLHAEAAMAAGPRRLSEPELRGRRSWWPALLSAAAVVVLVVGLWSPGVDSPLPHRERIPVAGTAVLEDADLVQAWVRLQWLAPAEEVLPRADEEEDPESEPGAVEAEEDPSEQGIAAVPQWMLVALDARGERPGEDTMTP